MESELIALQRSVEQAPYGANVRLHLAYIQFYPAAPRLSTAAATPPAWRIHEVILIIAQGVRNIRPRRARVHLGPSLYSTDGGPLAHSSFNLMPQQSETISAGEGF